MQVEANGTRLWFDVDGFEVVPDGATMRSRPTVVLVHGGPGTYDHSYFKPHFRPLSDVGQVVYLDLRDHGRSACGDASEWSFERCADDVRAFCDTLGVDRPIVFGHSMGGFVAMLYGARHPGHAGGLILQSTMARFDLDRLVEGVRRVAGDEVAALARRDYGGGDPVSDSEWDRVFAAFGPVVPGKDELARRIRNPAIAERGMDLMRELDVVDQLHRIECRTLVGVGSLDAVTDVEAAREIAAGLAPGLGQLEVIPGAGHFPWLDVPDAYWRLIDRFVTEVDPLARASSGRLR
jgi:pimeloyl-ACP methyl ester carboxylesterase